MPTVPRSIQNLRQQAKTQPTCEAPGDLHQNQRVLKIYEHEELSYVIITKAQYAQRTFWVTHDLHF
jgi:hypothetical protein